MKRVVFILMALAAFIAVPGAVNALDFSFEYENLRSLKNISDFTAGDSDTLIVAFKNPDDLMAPLVASLSVADEGDSEVTKNNFWVSAKLESKTNYPGGVSTVLRDLDCTEGKAGTFYCYNLSEFAIYFCPGKSGLCSGEAKNVSYPVLPKSNNNLTFYVTSNPALVPSTYSFNVTLYRKWEVPSIDDPIKKYVVAGSRTLFNASPANVKVWITTNENKSLGLDAILYSFTLQELYPPGGKIHVKTVGLEFNDTSNITDIEIRVYYDKAELPAGLDENSLRLFYFNESKLFELIGDMSLKEAISKSWEKVNSGVNVKKGYVWATPHHLSLSGVFGSPVAPAPAPTGGGGAGFYVAPEECEEDWVCSEWLPCFEGTQTRVCRDVNHCGTEENKPGEIRKCEEEKPVCGNGLLELGEECESSMPCTTEEGYAGVRECKNCSYTKCNATEYCGDGTCNGPETTEGCPEDCPRYEEVPAPGITGRFIDTVSNPAVALLVILLIGFLVYRGRKKLLREQ